MIRSVVLAVLLVGLTTWAYRSVWTAEWVYEDRATVAAAQTAGPWSARALSSWSWRQTPDPRSAHLVSLCLHLLIGLGVGVFAWKVGLTPFGAWVTAMLWLLAPITVESAAYAKARADQLVILGTLIACLSALGPWWTVPRLAGILGGLVIACGAKQAGVVSLALVPLMAWQARAQTAPRWAPWWLPAGLASLALAGGVWWYGGLRAVVNADSELGISMATDVTAYQWLSAQCGAVWYWLVASVWPELLTPDVDVDRLPGLTRAMGAYALLVAAGAWWRTRLRWPVLSLACGWVVISLLPRLFIQTPRSYLTAAQMAGAVIGIMLMAGLAADQAKTNWRTT